MTSARRRRGRLMLVLAAFVTALIWLIALPRLESHSRVKAHIKHLRAHRIDPAAMFYSDLEAMPQWEARIRAAQVHGQRSNQH